MAKKSANAAARGVSTVVGWSDQTAPNPKPEGSFVPVFKSFRFPNEIVTARRGSPLLIRVKTEGKTQS